MTTDDVADDVGEEDDPAEDEGDREPGDSAGDGAEDDDSSKVTLLRLIITSALPSALDKKSSVDRSSTFLSSPLDNWISDPKAK